MKVIRQTHAHHLVVLPGSSCGDSLSRLAESLTHSFERGHVDLTIVLDDVNWGRHHDW